MSDWSSMQYTKFERERTQPAVDLINRINIEPKTILDIGCGPGNSTARLRERFDTADILGVDCSDNMLEKAGVDYPSLKFCKCRIPNDLENLGKFDLLFSNACLHWIPDHASLLPKLVDKLNHGGMLAVQMPLVQNAMFYKTLDELIVDDKWNKLRKIQNFHNLSPDDTYDILAAVSDDVTVWDTTYYHIVKSHDAVIEWCKGSGLRPHLDALDEREKTEFLQELLKKIKAKYPVQTDGTVILKMPRMFFTAVKK